MVTKMNKLALGLIIVAISLQVGKLFISKGLPKMVERTLNWAGYFEHTLPESVMETSDIINYYGYPSEKHTVTTSDGYNLQLLRITGSRSRGHAQGARRPPVLLMHGFCCSSGVWVINGVDNSLGFVLADAGYDVYLGDLRGNVYSQSHTKLTPEQDEFWSYSLDEYALLDLPVMIDYILNITDYDKLTYIGHSMGSTIGLLMLAEKPSYNAKVRLAIMQAPVMFAEYAKTALRYLALNFKELKAWWQIFIGKEEFMVLNDNYRNTLAAVCSDPAGIVVCDLFLSILGGYNDNYNKERIHAYLPHSLAGTSWNVITHFAQIFSEKKHRKFDLGPEKNLEKYGQLESPEYNLSTITTPITCFWSYMDVTTDGRDIQKLADKLPSRTRMEKVSMDSWTHFDFHIGRNATLHHYNRILEIIGSEELSSPV